MTILRAFLVVTLLLGASGNAQTPSTLPALNGEKSEARPAILIEVSPARLYRGWPLVVTVGLRHANRRKDPAAGSAKALVIRSQGGDLGRLFRFEKVRFNKDSGRQETITLPLNQLGAAPKEVSLHPGDDAVPIARFGLPAEETATLTPATYIIRVHLNSSIGTSAESWHGTAWDGTELQIHDEPSQLTESLACAKVLAQDEYLQGIGAKQKAHDVLNDFLSRTPDTLAKACWVARAKKHEREGNLQAAGDDYCRAAKAENEALASISLKAENGASGPTVSSPRYALICQEFKRRFAAPAAPPSNP
ncbi:hypothetical protein [Myxococcus sp. NMCA1]|uniref:hypothetical protein n=1 Tax=Myxococcus sp. NMCA1 TaxID=2996785 RepID=UPI002285547F|nr:hypothetical protein [Myxococcus sp. NMCA1]WAM25561.1 hypothetical protein OZ403_34380 [Myxococcus sp. NMCA1]